MKTNYCPPNLVVFNIQTANILLTGSNIIPVIIPVDLTESTGAENSLGREFDVNDEIDFDDDYRFDDDENY